jgi:hypothetical protein
MASTMATLLTTTGVAVNTVFAGTELKFLWTDLTYKGAAASQVVGAAGGEAVARCLVESLDKWWNTTVPTASDYDATKLTNYKMAAGNYSVADQTRLTRKYTQDIYYLIGNMDSSLDDGT